MSGSVQAPGDVVFTGNPNAKPVGLRPPNTYSEAIDDGGDPWIDHTLTMTNFHLSFYGGPGVLTLTAGGSLVNSTLSLGQPGQGLTNNGTLLVNNSTLTIDGALTQSGTNSQIDVIKNGHVTLAGSENGGLIAINSGMLEFARSPSFMQSCEKASGNWSDCSLAFTGSSGAMQFDGETGKLMVSYNAGLNDLIVKTGVNGTLGIFHFAASAKPYSAAEFSVRGNEVLFHHIG